MNLVVYGDQREGIKVIRKLLSMGNNYFGPTYTKCAIQGNQIVGVIVGFPVSEKSRMDSISGKAFARTMGIFSFLKKILIFIRMAKLVSGKMDTTSTRLV